MTQLLTPHDSICAEVRRRGTPDGGLIGMFLDAEQRIVLGIDIAEGTSDVDELFLRHLVAIVADVRLAAVVFAVVRPAGRPLRIDRLLWRQLRDRLDGATTRLLDVMVVGEQLWWSAATGRLRNV